MQLSSVSANVKSVGRRLINSILRERDKAITLESKMASLLPPDRVRGMKTLDRSLFDGDYDVPTLIITTENTSPVMRPLRKYLLKLNNFKPVQPLDSEGKSGKIAYLDPTIVSRWNDIQEDDRSIFALHNLSYKNFNVNPLKITYDHWKYEDIFKAVLPEDSEIVSSYSQIGHIIHVNLREHLLEFKNLIGDVLIDKVKNAKTVVNKVNTIDSKYRNFEMEVLSGEENFMCLVKENKCSFEFDFSKVYWNPRLCTEHERIITLLKNGDVVFDVFAGVGPFSIPALKKKCQVFANDLNPDSFEWLNHNAKLNKVAGDNFKSYNLDGTDFIKDVVRKELVVINNSHNKKIGNIHIVMNLPAQAMEFLNTFCGLLADDSDLEKFIEPTVHVYCFTIGDTPEETAKKMLEENLKYPISLLNVEVSFVRNVSPKKDMMRVSFNLPKNLLIASDNNKCDSDSSEPPEKIKKIN